MFLTTVKLHGQSSKRKEIILTLQELANRCKCEDGCLRASLYQDTDDMNIIYFLEEWQSKEKLDKHNKSKSLAVLLGVETLLVESLEIMRAVAI